MLEDRVKSYLINKLRLEIKEDFKLLTKYENHVSILNDGKVIDISLVSLLPDKEKG